MKTETSKNKTGNGNKAQAALAEINAKIAELQQARTGLAQPLKDRYAELRGELTETETQIRDLDPTWKLEPTKPKAETKIAEILTAKGQPMTAEEIIKDLAGTFSNWKIKNTLKKKSTGAKAVFAVDGTGKYAVKAAAAA
jgi:uncharacterized protein YukE